MESDFELRMYDLIETYGNWWFFQKALDKQKVTRHIINTARSKYSLAAFYNSVFSFILIGTGLTGYLKSQPMELLFLIPAGTLWFWIWQSRFRREKKAIEALSKLATGIHARKLARDQFLSPMEASD